MQAVNMKATTFALPVTNPTRSLSWCVQKPWMHLQSLFVGPDVLEKSRSPGQNKVVLRSTKLLPVPPETSGLSGTFHGQQAGYPVSMRKQLAIHSIRCSHRLTILKCGLSKGQIVCIYANE